MEATASKYAALDAEPSCPAEWLDKFAQGAQLPVGSLEFAQAMDAVDPLRACRREFHIPLDKEGEEQVYVTGHSLGLMPRRSEPAVLAELRKWGSSGVGGHFSGELPWAQCEEKLPTLLGELVGAKDSELEICAMNSLTVNLHMLMAAFYRPSSGRAAIILEAGAFPSDRYAVAAQIRHHGFDPDEYMIEVQPRGDGLLHTDDITGTISANADRLALVLLGGVNYLTGQRLDMPQIAAHVSAINSEASYAGRPPILLGYDLAHAVGNIPLSLHEWGVDFAAWCTYKYLNSGAGCLGAIYVHSRHARSDETYPRLTGWWGVPFNGGRFEMRHGFDSAPGAAGFACSNVNPLMVACMKASLEVFRSVGGVSVTRRKAWLLTGYLEYLLHSRALTTRAASRWAVAITTPSQPSCRGCQLSLRVLAALGSDALPPSSMHRLEQILAERGVVVDAREPDIIRAAPVPLYNSFEDVHRLVSRLEDALTALVS